VKVETVQNVTVDSLSKFMVVS